MGHWCYNNSDTLVQQILEGGIDGIHIAHKSIINGRVYFMCADQVRICTAQPDRRQASAP